MKRLATKFQAPGRIPIGGYKAIIRVLLGFVFCLRLLLVFPTLFLDFLGNISRSLIITSWGFSIHGRHARTFDQIFDKTFLADF